MPPTSSTPASILWRWRPQWRVETLALAASVFFVLACNGNWWSGVLAGRSWGDASTWLFAGAVFVLLAALQFALLALLLNRWTAKPLLALLFAVTAFAVYYMRKYNVFLDPSMLRNVLRTDVKEARELVDWGLLPQLLLFAALPVALLWRVQIKRVHLGRALLQRLAAVALAIAAGVGALLLVFQDFSSLMSNQKELRYLITPANYLYSLA